MTIQGWDKAVSLLKEESSYDFKVTKLIRLSDDQNYFILLDPFGKKHLMFDRYYIHYGIREGDIVNCRVDKINCNGKIYLEPRHPYYQKDQVCEMEFLDIKEVESSKKKKSNILFVNDSFKSTAVLLDVIPSLYKDYLSKKITVKVKYIKKARLYLNVKE